MPDAPRDLEAIRRKNARLQEAVRARSRARRLKRLARASRAEPTEPTVDELHTELERLRDQVATLQPENARLAGRCDALAAELRKRDLGEPFKSLALKRLRAENIALRARVAELQQPE